MKRLLQIIAFIFTVYIGWQMYYYNSEGGNVKYYIQDERRSIDSSEQIILEFRDKYHEVNFENDQTIIIGKAYDDFTFNNIRIVRDEIAIVESKTFPIMQWIVIDLFDDSTSISKHYFPTLLQ